MAKEQNARTCYIDLPGEPVTCVSGESLTVVLKRPRDVLFDIDLGTGEEYSVTATDGYVCCVKGSTNGKDKKSLPKSRQIKFMDGQKLHLWLGRNFEGSLILKNSKGKILSKLPIKELDCTQGCSDDPKDKPAPIIISFKKPPANHSALTPAMSDAQLAKSLQQLGNDPTLMKGINAQGSDSKNVARLNKAMNESQQQNKAMDESGQQSVHVIALKNPNAGKPPPQVVAWLIKTLGKDFAEPLKIDTNPRDIVTVNWILAQIALAGGTVANAVTGEVPWLRELFKETVTLEKRKGQTYLNISGYVGKRAIFTAATYGAAHPKVVSIAGGAGSVKGTMHAAWGAAKETVMRPGTGVAILFIGILDTAEWWQEYSEGKADFNDWMGKVGVDVFKAGLSTALTSVLVAGVVSAMALVGFTVPILLIAVGAIGLSIYIGAKIDIAAKPYDLDKNLSALLRDTGKALERIAPKEYDSFYSDLQFHD